MNPIISALSFIIKVFFDAYIIVLLARFILQKLGASWHNPISQFIIKLTEKPLIPFRKIIPGFRGFDTAIFIFAFALQLLEVFLLFILQIQSAPTIQGVALISLGEIFSKFIYIYIYAIIINAFISWLPHLQIHPVAHIIHVIVNPLLSRARNTIPLIAGIDLSPIPIIFGLIIINILIINPIISIGTRLAMN